MSGSALRPGCGCPLRRPRPKSCGTITTVRLQAGRPCEQVRWCRLSLKASFRFLGPPVHTRAVRHFCEKAFDIQMRRGAPLFGNSGEFVSKIKDCIGCSESGGKSCSRYSCFRPHRRAAAFLIDPRSGGRSVKQTQAPPQRNCSPALENFFANGFHQKAYPLLESRNRFSAGFCQRGHD